jgi:PQQ-dependent catabolism-associated CXXCW motif protein
MRIAAVLTGMALLAMQPASSGAQTDPALFDGDGYRTSRYRSPISIDPTPASHLSLSASLVLDPERAALFIDVMPVEGGVRDPLTGTWTLSEDHLTIPGALWYPETGRSPVDADLWSALEARVRKARRKGPYYPIIVFCRADCWMSWNAARRLAESGIDNVWWLAEGTDGWHAAGRELVVAKPVAIPASRTERGE